MLVSPEVNSAEHLIVGRVGAVHGVHGWLKIFSHTVPRENIVHYLPWQLRMHDGHWKTVALSGMRANEHLIIVQFEGCVNREEARIYTGAEIAVSRTQLPMLAKNEYYWADLLGLDVLTKEKQTLGKVASLLETGSNDVLVVKGEREHLIPYLPGDVVLDINLSKGQIIVDWPADF